MVYRACPKCGAEVPFDSASPDRRDEDNVLFIRYDPRYKKVVLIDGESGVRREVSLSSQEQSPKPASRQIGGIIGPY